MADKTVACSQRDPSVIERFLDMLDGTFQKLVAVASGPRQNFTATIANGTSLSPAVDLGNCTAARIGLPAVVTNTGTLTLTFQVSHDGSTYKNLCDNYGNEYTVAAGKAAQSTSYLLPPGDFASVRFLKVRSGTSGSPVNQSQDTAISITAVS